MAVPAPAEQWVLWHSWNCPKMAQGTEQTAQGVYLAWKSNTYHSNQASVWLNKTNLIHRSYTWQQTGLKGSATNVLVQNTTGHSFRSCDHTPPDQSQGRSLGLPLWIDLFLHIQGLLSALECGRLVHGPFLSSVCSLEWGVCVCVCVCLYYNVIFKNTKQNLNFTLAQYLCLKL